MPTKRDETRPARRKELISAIAGEDDMRVNSLKRILVCLERRPDLQEALSAAIVEEYARDLGIEPGDLPVMGVLGRATIKDLTDMAADFERVLDLESIR